MSKDFATLGGLTLIEFCTSHVDLLRVVLGMYLPDRLSNPNHHRFNQCLSLFEYFLRCFAIYLVVTFSQSPQVIQKSVSQLLDAPVDFPWVANVLQMCHIDLL